MDGNRKNLKPALHRFFLVIVAIFASFSLLSANNLIDADASALTEVSGMIADGAAFDAVSDLGLQSFSDFGIGQDGATPPEATGQAMTVSKDNLVGTFTVLIGVLVLIVVILVFILANLINLVRVREGQEALGFTETLALTVRLFKNRWVIILGNGVLTLGLLIGWAKFARNEVGLHQDYKPEQPVYFSHEIHAGNYEIDCQYCHTGAGKGKNAWVPSTNVCMNCHKGIQNISAGGEFGYSEAEAKFYTEQIQKVRDSYENNEPIKWVRIHNLPDHAYFNHSQHVVVGKVECQTCHGPVETMDEVYQYSKLSMGWCIDCHRETKVDQALYEEYMPDVKVETVEDIGGTNCARCHY